MADTELDARGLSCPLPVLRANKALRALAPGDVLTVVATDPAAPRDFQAFCDTAGHQLVGNHEQGGEYTIAIRKKAG